MHRNNPAPRCGRGGRRGVLAGLLLATGLILILGSPVTRATVISGASDGYGLELELDALSLVNVDLIHPDVLGQHAQGAAPAPYSDSRTAIGLNVNLGTGVNVGGISAGLGLAEATGVLNSSASSDVDGGSGVHQAAGMGELAGLEFSVGDLKASVGPVSLLDIDLLDVASSTLRSEAAVSGEFGSLVASGGSVIEDLSIAILGTVLDLGLSVDANGVLQVAPNTTLIDVGGILGLDLILNEQIVLGDGISDRSIEVNALHFAFDGVNLGPLSRLISGEVIIGHAYASLSAIAGPAGVPEPGSLLLVGLGLAGLGARSRARR